MTKVRSIAKLHTQLYCTLFIYYMSIQNVSSSRLYSRLYSANCCTKCIHSYNRLHNRFYNRLYNRLQSVNGP